MDYKIRFGQAPEYNDLGEEAEFLDMLRSADPEVRVPEPYYFWQKKSTQNGFPRVKSFLAMELLDAVTLEDVTNGKEKLPDGFDAQAFFGKLRRFVETMHQKGVIHGDMHDRNIMVDRVTGNPRVIDFGTAKKIGEADIFTEDMRGSVFGSDVSGVAELERVVAQFLTEAKKSV